ncbi:MAG: hypothetical protein IJK60_07565 [Clostridia bacterium]|nr:hypothetical protein [Clostridia bacterium]
MIINEYDYLWTTEKADWVLVDSSYGYGIINKKTQMYLSVSDDALEKALIEKMLAEGCKTYNNINDAYADI